MECILKQCTCRHGNGKVGLDCEEHLGEDCYSCERGFQKERNRCVGLDLKEFFSEVVYDRNHYSVVYDSGVIKVNRTFCEFANASGKVTGSGSRSKSRTCSPTLIYFNTTKIYRLTLATSKIPNKRVKTFQAEYTVGFMENPRKTITTAKLGNSERSNSIKSTNQDFNFSKPNKELNIKNFKENKTLEFELTNFEETDLNKMHVVESKAKPYVDKADLFFIFAEKLGTEMEILEVEFFDETSASRLGTDPTGTTEIPVKVYEDKQIWTTRAAELAENENKTLNDP